MPPLTVPLTKTPTRMAAVLSPVLLSSSRTTSTSGFPTCASSSNGRVLLPDCYAISEFSSHYSTSYSSASCSAFGRRLAVSFPAPEPLRRATMTTAASSAAAPAAANSVHDFSVKDISGKDVALSKFKGKVLLIVNVASACGLTTSNYTELAELYADLKTAGLEILAFPCNQFGGQEPGTNEQIQEFACTRFKAEYPIFDKVEVNGPKTAPLYQFLKASKGGGILGDSIKWNFAKFLVDQDGKVVERYAPTTSPKKIEGDIKKLLGV